MNLQRFLNRYLDLPAIGQIPMTQVPTLLEVDGALVNASSLINALNQLNGFNIADATPNLQSSAAAALTLTNLNGLYQKLTNGGAVVITLDAAYNIVNALNSPFNGQSFQFSIFSSGAGTVATPTLLDSAVTLSGTTSITAGNRRTYVGQITQLVTTIGAPMTAGTTFVSLAQVGSSNLFTVTLATNTLVPVVGTAILLTNITGTLPPAGYPIVKVASATSFVIATPPGTVWTATAATVPGTTVVPTSAYTSMFPGNANMGGLFSPLITITAEESVAAIV